MDIPTPTKISQLSANRLCVDQIRSWLINFNVIKRAITNNNNDSDDNRKNKKSVLLNVTVDPKYKKSSLLLLGSHGTGKTLSVKVILEELDYKVKILDFTGVKGAKNSKDLINKILYSKDITNAMTGNNKGIAILIDELECISSSPEKQAILALQKINDIYWYCPIIFISNSQHNKLLSEIKKISFCIKFNQPTFKELSDILIKIILFNDFDVGDDTVQKIVSESQSDIRRMINIIKELKSMYGTNISYEDAENYFSIFKKKDVNLDIYVACDKLMFNYANVNTCLKYYDIEKVTIPLMIHQNYPKVITSNPCYDKNTLMEQITRSMSEGDLVENYIYGEQAWSMIDIHGFYACCLPSHLMHEHRLIKKSTAKTLYPIDLNKTSTERINKKNIKNADVCFRNVDIYDYIYMNMLLKKVLMKDGVSECVELLDSYKAAKWNVESLLKIDKFDANQTEKYIKRKNELIKVYKSREKVKQNDYKNINIDDSDSE